MLNDWLDIEVVKFNEYELLTGRLNMIYTHVFPRRTR